jgi:predicted ATP-dependent endonuclease of OLD family
MKIKKIKVKNYRLLKDFSIDLEEELSLVIGKNNTGKTSLLSVIDKFLNQSDKSRFTYDDLNIDCKNELQTTIKKDDVKEETFQFLGIKLKLFIQYEEKDNLSNISKVMMDLDPDNNFVILKFEYILTFDNFIKLKKEFNEYSQKKGKNSNKSETLNTYLRQNHTDYFRLFKKSIEYNTETKKENESNYIDLDKEKISLKNIINFKYIRANREVSNKDIDKTLSLQTSKIYKKAETNDEQEEAVDKFKDKLVETDSELSEIYTGLFNNVINKVKKFGGIREDDSIIDIISSLQHRELLDGNTTVMYNHNGHSLPEHYNGLGYMNLISMIFEIEIIINEFTKAKDEKPADINLFFIEEPEAHTHPQMQYIFIKNIKGLLKDGIKREDGENRKLQYIISTHSSHIVAESNFDDIKYLKKETANSVVAKNLTSLEKEYAENDEDENYRFLKQYLTLNRSELFFADKAILIEGDTERILLPAMMKKIDQENSDNPLLSQNISIVEVGAHSQIFEKFIDFIGIKTLVITDIDFAKKIEEDGKMKTKACKFSDNPTQTTNSSLNYFYGSSNLASLKKPEKFIKKENNDKREWVKDENGHLLVIFQTNEKNKDGEEYHARSFEDSFFHVNKYFILDDQNRFDSLTNKWIKKFKDKEDDTDVFDFAENGVGSKPSLAIEILMNSKTSELKEFSNWETPNYLKEGLEWLKQN